MNTFTINSIMYRQYAGETDLPAIIQLVEGELSEPYVIYTYRYFLHQWPHLSFLAIDTSSSQSVGAIVCKQSRHRNGMDRGYIGMLSVQKSWRKRGIARILVDLSIKAMCAKHADEVRSHGIPLEVVLETEFDNSAALGLYEALGFIREKRLFRFYMNGKDAFRLVLDLAHLRTGARDEDDSDFRSEPENEAASRSQIPLVAVMKCDTEDEGHTPCTKSPPVYAVENGNEGDTHGSRA